MLKKNEVYVLEKNKNTSWVIKQLVHAFMGNNRNHRSRGAVDDLMASGNSASGRPQHLGSDIFDCCPRRHEVVVYLH